MTVTTIDSPALLGMLRSGCQNLKINSDRINRLNVFPVPDGDTGINMWYTIRGGVDETIKGVVGGVGAAMQKFSHGVLFSARGNSGVILSQFISGFANGAKEKESLSVSDFIHCMRTGTEKAYNSVLTPVEGTMLTVMREGTEFAEQSEIEFKDFEQMLSSTIDRMEITLSKTPDMLAILKEAGVVDSGGAGFITLFEGMLASVKGISLGDADADAADTKEPQALLDADGVDACSEVDEECPEYGYCTEFILKLVPEKTSVRPFELEEMKSCLSAIGNSIVAVQDGDIVKVHVHTLVPEDALAYAHRFGEFLTLKIENMAEQHRKLVEAAKERKKKMFVTSKNAAQFKNFAVVAVASGEGLRDYFLGIGASVVIDGGQTQNPSAEVFIKAFEAANASHIVVLPNNSNIIMTAKQAAAMYQGGDVRIIPTKSIAECYSALSMMDGSARTFEDFVASMEAPIANVTTCYITTAIRDSKLGGVDVKAGDYIGICGDSILCKASSRTEALKKTIPMMPGIDDKEVFVVFSGANAEESDIDELRDFFDNEYPLADTDFIDGKQEIYDFIISAE